MNEENTRGRGKERGDGDLGDLSTFEKSIPVFLVLFCFFFVTQILIAIVILI